MKPDASWLFLVAVLVASGGLRAQEPTPEPLSIDALYSLPRITGTAPVAVSWAPDSTKFAFLWNDEGREFRDVWMATVDEKARLSAAGARWYAIQRAAENRQLGEALVRLQVTLGEQPLVKAPPNDLRQVVRVLRILKLDAEARRLAVQILLAKGL